MRRAESRTSHSAIAGNSSIRADRRIDTTVPMSKAATAAMKTSVTLDSPLSWGTGVAV